MESFSVIVPTYNRPEALGRLLAALAVLDDPGEEFEVIVVDDGGDAPLDSVVHPFQDRLRIELLRQSNIGPAGARNLGARRAGGTYLAFTDDDCEPAAGWLRAYALAMGESPDSVCGGPSANSLTENQYSEATQTLADFLRDRSNPAMTPEGYFAANNLCLRRETFLEMGGFDASMRFGEDREFCYRWAIRGGRFCYAVDALVYHAHALDLLSFFRLHFSYGLGSHLFRRRSARKGLPKPGVYAPDWYLDLILAGLRSQRGLRGSARSLLVGLSQMATAAGVLWGHLPTPTESRIRPIGPESESETNEALRVAGERIRPLLGRSRGRRDPW